MIRIVKLNIRIVKYVCFIPNFFMKHNLGVILSTYIRGNTIRRFRETDQMSSQGICVRCQVSRRFSRNTFCVRVIEIVKINVSFRSFSLILAVRTKQAAKTSVFSSLTNTFFNSVVWHCHPKPHGYFSHWKRFAREITLQIIDYNNNNNKKTFQYFQ